MRPTRSILAASTLALITTLASAADDDKKKAQAATTPPPSVVEGVRLARICDACGVVTAVKKETRKGKASGVGAVGGAVAGGVIGNKTTDSTVGTVGGAAVGGLLGNEIEKQVKKRKVWATTVTLKDGTVKKFDAEKDPGWKAGTIVEVGADNQLKLRT